MIKLNWCLEPDQVLDKAKKNWNHHQYNIFYRGKTNNYIRIYLPSSKTQNIVTYLLLMIDSKKYQALTWFLTI